MSFNSFAFVLFLPVVFSAYWFVTNRNIRLQNTILLVASYFFYSYWDLRFLSLLILSTLLDFIIGIKIQDTTKNSRKFWLVVSIVSNLSILGFFKYYNFFINSFTTGLEKLHFHPASWSAAIILPIGISFYTFHGLSYVFDIYRKKIKPTTNFVDYALFVSFFPLLVAGPIERATHLLPQVQNHRQFSYETASDGLRQILWGFFKKLVIADNCAELVTYIFNTQSQQAGSTLVVGAILFAFQIYGDFSGYSDIALGTARLFGFTLLRNFAYPYFSRDVAEFWRRWHISLTSWFKDYLYFPLGGSRGGLLLTIRNIFIIFIVSGFWHGANWTFLFWGFLHAVFYLPLILLGRNRTNLSVIAKGQLLPSPKEVVHVLATFSLTTIAWIFFRANTLQQGFSYVAGIFSTSLSTFPSILPKKLFLLIAFLIICEWIGREQPYAIANLNRLKNRFFRWTCYYSLLSIIYIFGYFSNTLEFIYFKF